MANQVYDPETEGQEPTYRSPDLGPGHNAPSGDSSDPRTIHKSPQAPPKEEATSPAGSPSDLRDAESSGGGFFNSGGDSSDTLGAKGLAAAEGVSSLAAGAGGGAVTGARILAKNAKNFFWGSKKRKRNTIGSGAATVVVGGIIIGGSLLSGPFEFVHIAQLLQQSHFSTQQNESDNRMSKLIRYARYAPRGDAYRTNLNAAGNRLADGVEVKLREQGMQSAYTKFFGLKDGYIIDRNNENFKGKSDEEIKQMLKNKFANGSLEFSTFTDGNGAEQLFMKQPAGYKDSMTVYRETLREEGYGKIASAISARVMAGRDGVSLHPLKILDNKALSKAEKGAQWLKDRVSSETKGVPDNLTAADAAKPGADEAQTKQSQQNAGEASTEGNGVASEGDSTAGQVHSGEDSNGKAISSFNDHISVKLGGGTAAIAGVLCMARGIAQNTGEVKQAQVTLPLTRIGMRSISEGNQVMAGQDIDMEQLSLDSKQLYDSENKTSWSSAQSVQAESGNPDWQNAANKNKPDSTLTTINDGSPLDFLVTGTVGSILDPVCSTAGQIVQGVVGFLGGPFSFAAGTGVGLVGGPIVVDKISHYLAGDAINPYAKGSQFGNYINYGSRLAANDQGLSSGGRTLSGNEEGQLASITDADTKSQFTRHNLAYRLFDLGDRMSLISGIMDRQSNSAPTNVTNMALATANVSHSLTTTFSNILSGVSHAATSSRYDYGFPEIAFSESEMDNPDTANPYANGDDVANILDNNGKNGEPDYISMVGKCFGDTVDQVSVPGPNGGSNQVWDVKYGSDPINIYSPDYKGISGSCNSTDSAWLKIRFFIFDTQNIKSAACYQGDEQSCSEMGFDGSGAVSGTTTSTTTVSSNAQELAQQILDNNTISKAGRYVTEDLQNTAAGKPAYGDVNISLNILQFLADLGQTTPYVITSITGAGSGHSVGSKHYSGHAVDLGCPLDEGKADESAKKYGLMAQNERCENTPVGNQHMHYSKDGY